MADNPNPDDDISYHQKTVILRDWWLIKCSIEFQGKRFGVAGTQIAETGAVRVFTSCPIIRAFDVFTLEASDGVCIILRGFLNKQRLLQSGFLPQISREFIFGFPPCWESKCNHCFVGVPSGSPINKEASRTILSPCNNAKSNLEDSSIPSVVEKKNNTVETNDTVGGGSSRKMSLRLHSKSLELMKKNTSNDGGVSKDVCEVINIEVDGCGENHTGADNAVDKVTSASATEESLLTTTTTSEQRNGKLKVTKTSPSGGSSKRGKSKKSEKILIGDSETMTRSRSKVKDNLSVGNTIRKIDFDEEVTPEKDAKKHKTNSAVVSPDSLGQKRSRSGRVLVSPLEFWRNEVPVYDLDRNLIQVNEGTPPSRGKGSVSRKPRR